MKYPPPAIGPVTKLTEFPWQNIFSTELTYPDGVLPWTFVSFNREPQLGSRIPNTVGVVAILRGAEDRLAVIREFRPALGGFQLSLPWGGVDRDEDIAVAAARELREETGLTLTRVHHISPPVALFGSHTDAVATIAYGEASGELSETGHGTYEHIEPQLLTYARAKRLLHTPVSEEFMSIHLYLALVGFVTAGSFRLSGD